MDDDIPTRTMFFFGTLMDMDLLAAVIGRLPAAAAREAAFLRGWRRVFVAGRTYPMLIPQPAGRVEGLLVGGLDERDCERLSFYEGWEYVTAPVTVRTLAGREVATAMFTCSDGVLADNRDWSLELWRRKHKPAALVAVAETMARFARVSGL